MEKRVLSHRGRLRRVVILGILVLGGGTSVVRAQSGAAGIGAASTQINSYFNVGVTLMYMIGGVVGLVGAVKV